MTCSVVCCLLAWYICSVAVRVKTAVRAQLDLMVDVTVPASATIAKILRAVLVAAFVLTTSNAVIVFK